LITKNNNKNVAMDNITMVAMQMATEITNQSGFWGQTVQVWDRWGIRLLFGGAVLGALALIVSLTSSVLLYRVSSILQGDLAIKTGSLSIELEKQKTKTGEALAAAEAAKGEAVKAHAETAKANARAEEAHLEAERIKQSLAWRILNAQQNNMILAALLKHPVPILNIRYTDGDPESSAFAHDLVKVFSTQSRVTYASTKYPGAPLFGLSIPPTGVSDENLRLVLSEAGLEISSVTLHGAVNEFGQNRLPGAPMLFVGLKERPHL
jgi:hypothetical protein